MSVQDRMNVLLDTDKTEEALRSTLGQLRTPASVTTESSISDAELVALAKAKGWLELSRMDQINAVKDALGLDSAGAMRLTRKLKDLVTGSVGNSSDMGHGRVRGMGDVAPQGQRGGSMRSIRKAARRSLRGKGY